MGNSQLQNINAVTPTGSSCNITKSRFVPAAEATGFCRQSRPRIKVEPFKRLMGWELELQGIAPLVEPDSTLLTSEAYFPDLQSLNTYIGHMVALKQICHLNIYDDFEIQTEKAPFCITSRQQLTGIPKSLNRLSLKNDIQKIMQLLVHLSSILQKAENIFIIPDDLVEINNQFYLKGFLERQCSKKKLIMAYIVWIFEDNENFQECLNVDNTLSSFPTLHRYIKEVFYTIKNDRIDDCDLQCYFKNLLDKLKYLQGGFDSFHACYRSKRPKYNTGNAKEWLLAKRSNEIYFVNIADGHVCQGRVMRKSKKISVEGMHLMFNSADFQVCFMLDGTKNMVKTTEFELDGCFTISDIEIKYKFPFRLKNPLMFTRGREVYLLDQMIYRYSIDENKIYQQSKKISDSLCLTQSVEFNYIVVRHSIDIFRYGIRIYFSDRYETLMPSGSAEMAVLMENIKIDIKHVEFCCEVFRGVFLMMADKNLWVLDLNFLCFFSYAPLQRVHNYFKGRGSQPQNGQFVFQILNQPFHANWLHHQQGLNVHIVDDILHVIANVTGKLFYLQYKLIFEAGLLYLMNYKPLYQQQSNPEPQALKSTKKELYFNVYNESMPMFRNSLWVHKGSIFLDVSNLRMQIFKNYTQIFMQTQEMSTNIKDIIQQNRKMQQQWSRVQIVLLLYKLWTMIHFLNHNNIAYKNLNLSNLWISAKREMKLVGWSEPQRNWHISDYKDYLLSSFNIITQNNYEKLNDKFLQKHYAQIEAFPVLYEKMQASIRHKAAEKRPEVQKHLLSIRQCLHGQLYRFIETYRSTKILFSFQYNTPRFSLMNIQTSKIKKMNAALQNHNSHQQYIFKQTDQYAWSEKQGCLFIFTASYQMYELKINVDDMKEETVVFQEYEYLPCNIIDCSFISCETGLYAFGGISRNSKKKMHYNLNVYHFNRNKLTWEAIAVLDEPRVKPKLVPSESGRHIYLMSGELGVGSDFLQTYVFDTVTKKVDKMTDLGIDNPFRQLTEKHICKVFQLSERYNIFLMWSVNSVSYQFKIFSSLIAGFQINFQGKIYLQEGADLPVVSIGFGDGSLHFLRPYGKYSKITIEGLDNPKLANKTLYFN